LDGAISYAFTNYINTQPLTIKKEVVGNTINTEQEYSFDLNFNDDCVEQPSITTTGDVTNISVRDTETANEDLTYLGGTIKLKRGQSVTIPNVPVGMEFTLSENNPDPTNNSFYDPIFETVGATGETADAYEFDIPYTWTVSGDTENRITVTNEQFMEIKIEKSGIDALDHHENTSVLATDKEMQTTLYRVKNADGTIDMQVAISGNSSKMIKYLPVDTYTVEEIVDWSWRYKIAQGTETQYTVLPNTHKNTVSFENEREDVFWLNGGAYCQNIFGNVPNN